MNGSIQDKTRINLSIPFIQKLLKKESKSIVISHLGRPKNDKDKNFSLKPVFNFLKEKINYKIHFYTEKITRETKDKISFLNNGELILFENIRFNSGELNNDDTFAETLSSMGDIYINDAFSCSHRKQASIHKITKYINNSYAGPQLVKEIESIDKGLNQKKIQ